MTQGKIPRIDELPAPRYFPEAVDHRVRLLINRVMDWVWAHPNAEFTITRHACERYFELVFYDENSRASYVQVGEDCYWSQLRYCNVENLQILIAALKLIDAEGKS